jgi:hypothetical protein
MQSYMGICGPSCLLSARSIKSDLAQVAGADGEGLSAAKQAGNGQPKKPKKSGKDKLILDHASSLFEMRNGFCLLPIGSRRLEIT